MNIRDDILINMPNPANPTGAIEVSLVSGASVFNGQQIYLTVTVRSSSAEIIRKINRIKIDAVSNSVSYITYENFKGVDAEAGSYGSAIILLTIKSTGSVSFKVIAEGLGGQAVQGVNTPTIQYNSLASDPKAIITLSTENEFISTPTSENPIDGGQYNLYSGNVADGTGVLIKKAQIIVAAQKHGQLFPALINITDENNQPITIIDVHTERPFFVLNSDENGEISFRAYPIQGQSARINFVSEIKKVTDEIFTSAMCIYPDNSEHRTLDDPFIDGLEIGGILKKPSGETSFHTTINPYPNANQEDVLAFFTEYFGEDKKTLLSPTYRAGNDVGGMSFPFTYDQLEPEKLGGLYYAVISKLGSITYSESLRIKYISDPDSPGNNKNRIFDKVIVYSSYAGKKPTPSTTGAIVYESSAVNFYTITQGLVFGMGGNNKNNAGLYVIIKVTDDKGNKNLPHIDTTRNKTATLNVNINSSTSVSPWSVPFAIDNTVLTDTDGKTKYALVTIPFCILKGIAPISSDQPARLYIDYEIKDKKSHESVKSKVWGVDINTLDPDDIDDNSYYGCGS